MRRLDGNTEKTTIATACSKARDLHIQVYAEGIENMNQLTQLRKNGCTAGQGYYFSKPISIEEFLALNEGK